MTITLRRLSVALPLLAVAVLLAGCGSDHTDSGHPTSWTDVAFLGVMFLGWAAIIWASGRD